MANTGIIRHGFQIGTNLLRSQPGHLSEIGIGSPDPSVVDERERDVHDLVRRLTLHGEWGGKVWAKTKVCSREGR